MRHASYQTAVIGAATAGTGVVLALLQHDVHELVVLDAMFPTAASLQNQKWLQSGCFYLNNPALALKLWQGFPAMVQLARPFLQQCGAHFVAVSEETLRDRKANAVQCGIPLPRITPVDLSLHPLLGSAACIGGFLAPDAVIDFPAFLTHLRQHVATRVPCIQGTVQRLVREGDHIVGAIYTDHTGQEVMLHAETYILCPGA